MSKLNHMLVSICKSIIRLIACTGLVIRILLSLPVTNALVMFGTLFGIAELLGIIEELADKRKETK